MYHVKLYYEQFYGVKTRTDVLHFLNRIQKDINLYKYSRVICYIRGNCASTIAIYQATTQLSHSSFDVKSNYLLELFIYLNSNSLINLNEARTAEESQRTMRI